MNFIIGANIEGQIKAFQLNPIMYVDGTAVMVDFDSDVFPAEIDSGKQHQLYQNIRVGENIRAQIYDLGSGSGTVGSTPRAYFLDTI